MVVDSSPGHLEELPLLPADFADRLESSLQDADRDRRRVVLLQWAQRILPIVLLVGPIVGWRLMLASPDGPQVTIGALAWLAFLLDVAVHADTVMLAYLGLQLLPTIVGLLLFALIAATLLMAGRQTP